MYTNPPLMTRIHFNINIGKTGFVPWIVLLLSTSLIVSCGNTRQITYMQGKFDTAKLSKVPAGDPIIQKGDLISIIVYSDNPQATNIFNQALITVNNPNNSANTGGGTGSSSGALGNSAPTVPGYLVDERGNIRFQGLGLLYVEGLTRGQLKDTLDSRLKEYLTNPYYSIRFLNYRFTMLGEVNKPGIFNIPGDRISILEALGLAGDMTFYGRRDNVLIIHENNGVREFARLDLTKPEIMGSPNFYLQQNDVVIVEATNKKIAASDQVTTRNVTIILSIVSTLAIIYSILK